MGAGSCSVTNTSLEDASDSGEDGQKFRHGIMIIFLALPRWPKFGYFTIFRNILDGIGKPKFEFWNKIGQKISHFLKSSGTKVNVPT